MKRFVVSLLIVLGTFKVHAINIDPERVSISLITCSPGEIVYERFGHSAIRVRDLSGEFDFAFNYGMFDFNEPGFYIKFVKGETDYYLSYYDFEYFLHSYSRRDSHVWEQELNLTNTEKTRLIQALLENALPENRQYRYNFIYDNCSTRPRDLIEKSIDQKLIYQNDTVQRSFRNWVRLYVGYGEPVMLGIDLIFGRVSDKIANRQEAMFLPETLMNEFAKAEFANSKQPIVIKTNILNQKQQKEIKSNLNISLIFTLLLLLVLSLITVFEWKKKKYYRIIDTFIYMIYGFIGVIIFFLMFISVHPMVQQNINILWMNPLFIFSAVFIWISKLRSLSYYFHFAVIVLSILTLILYFSGFQDYHIASLPLVILLLLRASLGIQKNKAVKLYK